MYKIEIINYNGNVHLEIEDNSYVSPIVVHNCAVETMACGTATRDDTIPEVVLHGIQWNK